MTHPYEEPLVVVRVRMEAPGRLTFPQFTQQLRNFTTLVTTLQESQRWAPAEEIERRRAAVSLDLNELARRYRETPQQEDPWNLPEGVAAAPPPVLQEAASEERPRGDDDEDDYFELRRRLEEDGPFLAHRAPVPMTLRQDVASRRRVIERGLRIETLSYGSPIDIVVGTRVDEIMVLLSMLGALVAQASNLRRHFSDNQAARSRNQLRVEITDALTQQVPHLMKGQADPGVRQAVDTLLRIEQVEVLRQLPAGSQPPALPGGAPGASPP